jgi:hypothetical protein
MEISSVWLYSLMKTFYFNQIYDKIECFLNNYNKKRNRIVILLEAIYIISALNQRPISRCIAVLAYQEDPFYRTLPL